MELKGVPGLLVFAIAHGAWRPEVKDFTKNGSHYTLSACAKNSLTLLSHEDYYSFEIIAAELNRPQEK